MTKRKHIVQMSDGIKVGRTTVWAENIDDACDLALQRANVGDITIDCNAEPEDYFVEHVVTDVGTELECGCMPPMRFRSEFEQTFHQLRMADERIAHLEAELSAWQAGDYDYKRRPNEPDEGPETPREHIEHLFNKVEDMRLDEIFGDADIVSRISGTPAASMYMAAVSQLAVVAHTLTTAARMIEEKED